MNIITRNNVRILGNGTQPMLMLHGYGCDQNMWNKLIPYFENDYKIVLIDHVGSGKSDWDSYNPQKYSTLDGYADDLLEICDTLKIENGILVLHSVSTMIGLLAAVKAPHFFSDLVMVCPSPCYINKPPYKGGFDEPEIKEMLDTLDKNFLGWSSEITKLVAGPDQPEVANELYMSFCQHRPDIAKNFARTTFMSDNREDLPKLRVPTLVLQCADDVIASVEVGRYVHEQIAGSTFELLPIAGHSPHLSHPELTATAMRAYLKEAVHG